MRRLQGKRRSNLAEMFLIDDQEDPEDTGGKRAAPVPDPAHHKDTCPTGAWSKEDPGAWPRWALVGILAGVTVGVVCGMSVYAAFYRPGGLTKEPATHILHFFNLSDANDILWVSLSDTNMTSLQHLVTSQRGVMITIRVTSVVTDDNMTEPMVLFSGDGANGSIPFRKLFEYLMKDEASRDGVRCDVSDERTADAILRLLRYYDMVGRLHIPVWLHAGVIKPTQKGDQVQDATQSFTVERVAELVQTIYPKVTLSLGWVDDCGNVSDYTPSTVQALWKTLQPFTISISFEICLDYLGRTYPLFQWLLDRNRARFNLFVFSKCKNPILSKNVFYDLLMVKNDMDRRRMYLDVADDILKGFRRVEDLAGTPTNVFKVPEDDGVYVQWSRDTNTRKGLLDGLHGSDMLVGDVSVNLNGTLWMGRYVNDVRDMTLIQWMRTARNAGAGVRIQIRSDDVIVPTITTIQRTIRAAKFKYPIWLHANIYEGQDSRDPIVNRRELKRELQSRLPFVTVCLGWTTGQRPGLYDESMVGRMLNYAKDFRQPVAFVIRASVARSSWDVLMDVLDASRSYKLLIWADDNEQVDVQDLVYLHQRSEVHRVFYSLPYPLKESFLKALHL